MLADLIRKTYVKESQFFSKRKKNHTKLISKSKTFNATEKRTKYNMISPTSRLSYQVKQKYRNNMAQEFSEKNRISVILQPEAKI